MSLLHPNEEESVKDKKKNARKASKTKARILIEKQAKKLQDKTVMEMAESLPGANANAFVKEHHAHQKAEQAIAAANKVKREVRNRMKSMKIDMSAYDRVNKLSKMDPEDVKAKKATEALYEQQLSMELSEDQKARIVEINQKRENARKAMSAIHGDDAGKEIGSAANAGPEDEEEEKDEEAAVPSRNEAIKPGVLLNRPTGIH